MKTYIKIKLKYLGEEARINKHEQQKWLKKGRKGRAKVAQTGRTDAQKPWIAEQIYLHRIHVIRPELRDTQLAYGFLRGLRYDEIETKRYTDPNWENVKANIRRFDSPRYGRNSDLDAAFEAWKNEAPPISTRKPRAPKGERTHRTKEQWDAFNHRTPYEMA